MKNYETSGRRLWVGQKILRYDRKKPTIYTTKNAKLISTKIKNCPSKTLIRDWKDK
jgi:hypothetical protein